MKINNIINGRNKAIVCIDEDKLFYKIADAAAHYSMCESSIYHVLSGKKNSAKGHSFRYATEEEIVRAVKDITIQEEASVSADGTRTNRNCEPCFCLTDGVLFASMRDAAERYNLASSQVSYACGAPDRTAGGKAFCKLSDLPLRIPYLREVIGKSNSYDLLIERENMRKEIVAKISAAEEEVYSIEFKMNEMAKQFEEAKARLDAARVELQSFS